jgi:hypothetical protein
VSGERFYRRKEDQPPYRIALDEAAFRDLVDGRVVTRRSVPGDIEVQICLSDIGWAVMKRAIADAQLGLGGARPAQ